MQRLVRFGFVGAVLLSGLAFAGEKDASSVWVDTSARHANGGLGGARNSADTTQSIGCAVFTWLGSAPLAVCFASDVKLTTGVCTSTDANIRASALAVKGDSWIDFTWDGSGQCTSLEVNNKSSLEPKR